MSNKEAVDAFLEKAKKSPASPAGMTAYTKIGLLFGGLIFLSALVGNSGPSTPPTACTSDWRQCKDNADLINNYGNMARVEADCEFEANEAAKYGTPEWPWGHAFGTFLKGDDYPRTGVVTVKEHDARFTNMFNAKVHTTVSCRYDLNTMNVLSVKITAN